MRLFSQVRPLRIYGAMYAFFWGRGGIRITTRIRSSSTRGADFSAPRISRQSVIKFSTEGDWVTGRLGREGALSSLASKAWSSPSGRAGRRAWSSGETKVSQVRLWLWLWLWSSRVSSLVGFAKASGSNGRL